MNWWYVLLKSRSKPQLYRKYLTWFCDQQIIKRSPTVSKVLIVFLLANSNLSLPVSFTCFAVSAFALGNSQLSIADLVFIKSVLILLVKTQTILLLQIIRKKTGIQNWINIRTRPKIVFTLSLGHRVDTLHAPSIIWNYRHLLKWMDKWEKYYLVTFECHQYYKKSACCIWVKGILLYSFRG